MRDHVIRFAAEADSSSVADVIEAMDRHYRPDAELRPWAEYRAMAAATISAREGTRFVLCLAPGGAAVGIACVAVLRPGRDLRGLVYVKDLFLKEEARGLGLGTEIMRFLARFCLDEGIGRIDLGTDRSNDGAQRLYDALGGSRQDKVSFTFPADTLRKLAGA
ncbi:MAG: GNAT family N-acetyltransferase [Rhodospirillaceae bacterium]|nr:GNAT family N-acetyltransferase [Rhodospirillaceae bacterium]